MSKLYFKIGSDWEEVVRLRNEIVKLKQELKGMNASQSPAAFNALNSQLSASTQQLDSLVVKAAQAGAEMENGFKKKIFDASQSVNGFTEKILVQKAVVKDVEADVKRLGDSYRTALKNNPMSASGKLSEYTSAKKALDEEKAALFELTQEQANARLSVKKLRDEYALYKNDGKQVVETNQNMIGSMKQFILTIAGADAIKSFISNVVEVSGNFQKMETVLGNTLGSVSKAKETMDMLADFGAKTPFQVDELTAAYVKLANQGFTPTMNQMKKLGDLASSTGKSFDQLAEAIIDAQVGENERLKEFGIRASKNGDKVTYTFKEQETTIQNTASAIREYILSLGDLEGVIGANEKISATFIGRLSNIQDELTNQFKGFGEQFYSELSGGINIAATLVENLNKIIPVIGGLVTAYGAYKAAVIAVTAAHKAGALFENIRLIGMMRKELGLATAAQQAFNTASKANIYAALISVLLGLGMAVYMFSKKTDKATEAQKRLSNASVELNAEIGKETKIAKDLFDKLKKAKQGTKEYSDAKQVILDKYGQYLSGMNLEISTLKDQEKAYNAVTNAIKRNVSEKLKEKFVNTGVGDASGRQSEALKMIREALNKKYTSFGDALKGEYNPTKESEAAFNAVKDLLAKDDISGAEKLLFKDYGMNFMGDAGKGLEQYKNAAKEIKQVFKDADDLYSFKQNDSTSATQSNVTKELTDATNKIATLKKEIADLRSGKIKVEVGETVKSVIDSKNNELQEAEKSLETLTGKSSKQESAAEKLRKEQESLRAQQEKYNLLLDEQTRKRVRAEEDAANEIRQAEIDADKDGAEKVLKQRKLNHDKEIQSIVREADDRKQAVIDAGRAAFEAAEETAKAEDPKHIKKTFDKEKFIRSEPAQKEFLRINKAAQGKVDAENAKFNRGDDLANLLDEYQDFTDQRLAIEKKFNEDIKVLDAQRKTALENGDMEQVAKMDRSKIEAEKKKKEDLSGVAMNEFKADIDWTTLFGNLDVLSPELLNKLRDKLKGFIAAAADKLKPEDLKTLSEAMTDVDLTIADKSPYEALKSGLSTYKTATEEAAVAQNKLNKLEKEGKEGTKEYKDATKELTDAQRRRAESLKSITQAANSIGSQGMEVVNAGNEIVDMLENLGVKMPEAVSETLNGIGQVMSGLESIDITKPFSAVTGTIKVLAGVGNTVAGLLGFGGADYSHYNEMKDQYESLNSIWDELIEKKKEYISISYGMEAVEVSKEAEEVQKKINENNKALGLERLNSGASAGSHSIGRRIWRDMSNEGWSQAQQALGADWKDSYRDKSRMTWLFDLTAEQLEKIKYEASGFWQQLDGDVQGYLQGIIDGEKKIEDIQNQLQEQLTQTSFDNVFDNFMDTLIDMDSAAEDFANDFEGYMRRAVLSNILGPKLKEQIKEWYENFSDDMAEKKDENGNVIEKAGVLTDDEMKNRKEEWDKIVQDGIAERDALAKTLGWSSGSDSSQEASKRGFETMSQDTATELNGRFAALQIAGEETKNQSNLQTQSLNLLTAKAESILTVNTDVKNIADETRNLIANSYLELIQISENTGYSARYLKDIKADIAEVKRNTSKL